MLSSDGAVGLAARRAMRMCMVTEVKSPARRRPADVIRGLVPWLPIPPTVPPGPPIILEGREITSVLPYDRPDSFLREVRLFADGKTAEGIHIVDPARCQGHRFGTPLLPGAVLGDLLYLTFGVLLLHSPLVSNETLDGQDRRARARRGFPVSPPHPARHRGHRRRRTAGATWRDASRRTAGQPPRARRSSRPAAAGSP